MCVGELTWKREKQSLIGLIFSGLLLFMEITFVSTKALSTSDRSMYLSLPVLIYFLVLCFREWNPDWDTRFFGGISTAIYVMQFGIITVVMKVAEITGCMGSWLYCLTWLMVIIVPTAFYWLFRNTKIVRILF